MPDRSARIVPADDRTVPEGAAFDRPRDRAGRVRAPHPARAGGRRGRPAAVTFAVLAALLAGSASPARPAGKPERPRLCPEDAPEGVRLPPRPGCGSRGAPAPKRETGVYDLGNGTDIRIGGRIGAAFDARR
ncbi:hypothetical protein [uncultured Methylobacterium sp.]|uniref:hypothetical protein n=1 Tax=uncultured Methylobacterium sp. TaxID=157278 RepID=UPI0035C95A75